MGPRNVSFTKGKQWSFIKLITMPDSFLSFAQVLKCLIKIVTPNETYASKCNTVFFTLLKKAAQST